MKILFIAPLPPPITGHSIVSRVLLDELEASHQVNVIDLTKDSFNEGIDGLKRILQIFSVLKNVISRQKEADIIYLTLAESLAGNIKDLLIYLVCYPKLSRMYIHLHGGTIKKQLWDKYRFLSMINSFFIKRMAGAIISGNSHLPIFNNILPVSRIHIIPNFAEDYLFVTPEEIEHKFRSQTLKILYMSNLIPKKGYNELADAYFLMPEELKDLIQIDFAGGFGTDESKKSFLMKIAGADQITYHGIVSGEKKKALFSNAHIFCLPTSYLEGQPISILEAYASGCIVLTTGQSGIYDIFKNMENGYEILPQSAESIVRVLSSMIRETRQLEKIARNNLRTALVKYRTRTYQNAVKAVLESVDSHSKTY